MKGRAPAVPVDGDEADEALPPQPAATDVRSDRVASAAGRSLLRRTVPRARRRALAFLHRDKHPQDVRIPQENRDESPTAH